MTTSDNNQRRRSQRRSDRKMRSAKERRYEINTSWSYFEKRNSTERRSGTDRRHEGEPRTDKTISDT